MNVLSISHEKMVVEELAQLDQLPNPPPTIVERDEPSTLTPQSEVVASPEAIENLACSMHARPTLRGLSLDDDVRARISALVRDDVTPTAGVDVTDATQAAIGRVTGPV